jgi:hypothetical protein
MRNEKPLACGLTIDQLVAKALGSNKDSNSNETYLQSINRLKDKVSKISDSGIKRKEELLIFSKEGDLLLVTGKDLLIYTQVEPMTSPLDSSKAGTHHYLNRLNNLKN